MHFGNWLIPECADCFIFWVYTLKESPMSLSFFITHPNRSTLEPVTHSLATYAHLHTRNLSSADSVSLVTPKNRKTILQTQYDNR